MASKIIASTMTRENTAPLFFVNRLQESCKKFKDGEAIFSRSAV